MTKKRDEYKKVQQTMDTINAVAEAADTFNDILENGKLAKGLGAAGAVVAVMQIVMIWMPEVPSDEEVAIKNMVKAITEKIKQHHNEQMAVLS